MIPNGVSLPCDQCGVQVAKGRGLLAPDPWRVFCLDHVPDEKTRRRINLVSSRLEDWHGAKLAGYQKQGAYWLASRESAILGDEQGLGKTVQAICTIPHKGSALVICPKIAKLVWRDHFDRLRPDLEATALEGMGAKFFFEKGRVIISNFAILPERLKEIHGRVDVVIVDECHYLKNKSSERTLKTQAICWRVMNEGGRVYFLSGTPIKNTPEDLWSLLTTLKLSAKAFGSRRRFYDLMGASKGRYGTKWGNPVDQDVPRILRNFMLRREVKDVLPELPPRRFQTIHVDLPGPARKACDEFMKALAKRNISLEEAIEMAAKNSESIDFLTMSKVCKALANAKVKALMNYLDDAEESTSDPILVWSRHVDPVELVATRPGWRCIHGGTSQKQREEIQREYDEGKLRGIAMTIKAGSTALTLVKGNLVLELDYEWSPADNDQFRARSWRLGQKRRVLYVSFQADHVLDRRMSEILTTKNALIDAVVRASAVKMGDSQTQNQLFN